jgi:hypothetical protein
MTLRLTPLLTLCAMLSLTTGCGVVNRVFKSGSKPKQPGDEAKQEVFIGVVDMVNPEQHFVLVRTIVNMKIKSGSTLEARSPEGEKTTLSVTPEHKVNFISADIMSGTPRRGDAVVLLASEKKDDGDANKETTEPLKPYVPSEADALIPGQAPSPAAATMVPGVAPSDAEMIPGVAPKNVPPATHKPSTGPARVAPGSGEALPPVAR